MNPKAAIPTVQIDNDHIRVTEWRFAPGAATGFHRHEHDYVVVPARDGELKLIGPKGEVSTTPLRLG
jgi:beta-alanine degradation protein BauB